VTDLVEARVRLGLSLTDLSQRTKISVATLQTIERNDLGKLPAGICGRGMLRAYSTEVQCDPDEIVGRFRRNSPSKRSTSPRRSSQRSTTVRPCSAWTGFILPTVDAMDRRRARVQAITGATLVLMSIVLYVSLGQHEHSTKPSLGPGAVSAQSAPPVPTVATSIDVAGHGPDRPTIRQRPIRNRGTSCSSTFSRAGRAG